MKFSLSIPLLLTLSGCSVGSSQDTLDVVRKLCGAAHEQGDLVEHNISIGIKYYVLEGKCKRKDTKAIYYVSMSIPRFGKTE